MMSLVKKYTTKGAHYRQSRTREYVAELSLRYIVQMIIENLKVKVILDSWAHLANSSLRLTSYITSFEVMTELPLHVSR